MNFQLRTNKEFLIKAHDQNFCSLTSPLLYYFSYSLCTCTHTGPYADFVYIDKRKKMSGNQIKREKFTERLEYSVFPKSMTSNLLAKIWSQPLSHDKIWWWQFKLCIAGKWPKVDLLIKNSCVKSHFAFWINKGKQMETCVSVKIGMCVKAIPRAHPKRTSDSWMCQRALGF